MTRIGQLFERLARAYITAGDPHRDRTPALCKAGWQPARRLPIGAALRDCQPQGADA
jgi:hypothetical protein